VSNQKLALVSTLEIASVGLGVVVRSYLEKSAARYAVNPRNFFGELKRRNVYKVAIAYAVGLGEREATLRWADRAVELLPSSHDARSGPAFEETRARIQARFGDGDRAIPTLKHLLEIPYASPITPALLRLHPDFDPLRGDPRFQELCKDK
jgi:hypothetical protein